MLKNEKKLEKKRNKIPAHMTLIIVGTIVILIVALFCVNLVKNTIVNREEESIKSIAHVCSENLEAILRAKSNLIYASFSGDMENEESIQKSMLKVQEKCKYISLNEVGLLKKWEIDSCEEAARNPGEVIAGPISHKEDYYVLYMTKAVYMNGSITGYVQVELNLDEIYQNEQGLSELLLANEGYCFVIDGKGNVIMSKDKEEEMHISTMKRSNCEVIWSYQIDTGGPKRVRKLVAYDTMKFSGEEFVVCIGENYEQIVAPIEQISAYLLLLAAVHLIWCATFLSRIFEQKKEENKLLTELQYERELNEANEALKNQENLMQKYNHSKTNAVLTGAIAHEFNNLMTPIVLYSELLDENEVVKGEMPEETQELVDAVHRCEELARQLLDYSRHGRAEKVLSDYNATFAIQSSVNMMERVVPKNVKLTSTICHTPYYVRGQIGTLNQIILNLVTNSCHAIGDRPGVIDIKFGKSTDDETHVRLIVEDNGGGIPKEIRKHVFEPFFTTKMEKEGTGIGLTVVKRMVEEHGGSIRVTTEEGKGTRFCMDFPIVKTEGHL